MTFKKGGRRGRLSGYARSNDVLLSYKLLDDGGVYHNNDKKLGLLNQVDILAWAPPAI